MADRPSGVALSQTTISTNLATEFPMQDFIDALWYNLGIPLTSSKTDFWGKVISDASRGHAELFPFQRSHLKAWIEENKFHITQNFSHRAKITLNHRLELL